MYTLPSCSLTTLYPPTGANALLSAEQIRRLDASEANKHYHQHEQIQRCAHGSAQSRFASVRLCDVRVRDGRAVWARRHGDDERAGANAAVSPVIPFFWCIPVSLVAAELTTAIPVEGGFYRWVRAAFGDFWGFQAGWWNWSASFLLAAAYAVLATDYLSFYFPAIVGWKHHMVSVLVIAVVGWINVRGIQMVGAASTVMSIFVLLVVAALCAIAAAKWHHNPFLPLVPPHVPPFQVFGAGLALGLWLYSGYEQVSSVAEEVENPQRNYPIALAIVVPLSMATYFLPTMFSLAALGDWQKWHTGYFSDAARLIGGPWLGFAMTIAAMITNLSLLNATVLTSTRMPSTMAEDGYLPATFSARHPRYGTPCIAIIVSSIIYALLAQKTMVQLLTIYVWLRIGVTILTVLSSWQLRKTQPDLPRPFRIPWGRAGLL